MINRSTHYSWPDCAKMFTVIEGLPIMADCKGSLNFEGEIPYC